MLKNSRIIGANQKRSENGNEPRGSKDFIMSRSQLVDFYECPARWHDGGEVEEESKAMNFGSVLDCLVTTPAELAKKFIEHPALYPATPKSKFAEVEMKDWTTRAKYCQEWEAEREAQGFTVVSLEMMADAKKAQAALFANDAIAALIQCSEKQVLILAEWHDEATGLIIPLAALLDLVPNALDATWGKSLADIKTARNGNPAKWPNVCEDKGYDVQAALYFDLYRAARPDEDRTDFVHVVQENKFPFHVVSPPPALSVEFLEWGRSKYKAALRQYCQCLATNVWPSYPQVGFAFGHTQIIGPDHLWNYKNLTGAPEFRLPPETKTSLPENADVPTP